MKNSFIINVLSVFLLTIYCSIIPINKVFSIENNSIELTLREKSIVQAKKSLDNTTEKAKSDINRPSYHFTPPANWMNDINGPIFYNGYYHIFYQHNPYNDFWQHIHWGHAKSADLIHWQHLPIALWPSYNKGELHCFSGTSIIDTNGTPMIFYTKVTYPEPQNESAFLWPLIAHEQWAAIPEDNDLILWRKHPKNPILTLENHGGPNFEPNWRDPFIFQEAGRTFMILGANIDDKATIPIYEAKDNTFLTWEYKGILYEENRTNTFFFECPNFFKINNKWYLFYSAHKPVAYYAGVFDIVNLKFVPNKKGIVDYSYNFYASNIMQYKNRLLLYGWIKDFKENMGWNGSMILPRTIVTNKKNQLITYPVEESKILRKAIIGSYKISIENKEYILDKAIGKKLEIELTIRNIKSNNFGIIVFKDVDKKVGLPISIKNNSLIVEDITIPIESYINDRFTLNIFLDNAVSEIFLNKGQIAITKVHYPTNNGNSIAVFSNNGSVDMNIKVWRLEL